MYLFRPSHPSPPFHPSQTAGEAVIRALVRRPHQGLSELTDLETISDILLDKHAVLWLDVEKPTPDEIDLLRREFGFHELALEDATIHHERPKLDEYGQFYFLVFYSLETKPNGTLHTSELNLFASANYLVAVHSGPAREIEEGLRRWEANQQNLGHGTGALLYALLDSIVDNYFQTVDNLAEKVAGLEEAALRGSSHRTMQSVFKLKKQLLTLRRALSPERDALNVLMRRDLPLLDARTIVYLRDVYDHLVRIIDAADLQGDLLSSVLDVHLSSISNRLNQNMKTLTSVTIILMSMALVTGVYGMNFRNMPELDWPLGYLWALALMAAIGGGLYLLLKRSDWL